MMITIDRTRLLADERGVSLSFLCRKMGVAKAYFIDKEKAGKEIPVDRLEIIADCLYTTVDYLLGKTDQKEKLATPTGSEREAKETLFKKMLNDIDSGKGPKRAVLMGYGGAGKIIEMSESEYETMVKILDTMRNNQK